MKKQLLFFLLLIVSSVAYAQFNKVDVAKCPEQLEIYQVDDRENSTIVYMRLNGISSVIPGMWSAYINEKTVAKVNGTNKEYHLINSINMPISSEAEAHSMIFDNPNQIHCFALEFEKLPRGAIFDIIEEEQNPYGFNFYGIAPDTTQVGEFVNLDKMVEDYPIVREKIQFIRNDNLIQTVKANGIAVTMYVQYIDQYGKYYMVNMDLQNFSGKSILFTLNNVSATGFTIKNEKIDKTIPLEVLTASKYDNIVANKQGWNNFWAALGGGLAAYAAGHSSSTTTYSGSQNTSVYANAYAYSGNNYGYASAYGNAYTTTYGKTHTSSYNGAAAYAAQQNANAMVQRYASEQYLVREQLNEGYVKSNTIRNQVEYSGYFNIKHKKIDHMKVVFIIDGIEFPFFI